MAAPIENSCGRRFGVAIATALCFSVVLNLLSSHISGVLGSSAWCRGDEKLYGAKCYAFYEIPTINTYDDAEAYCSQHGKHLSAPQSAEEQLFFTNSIEQAGWSRALIGLRYTQESWRWSIDQTVLRGQGCYEQISIDDSALLGQGTYSPSLTTDSCVDMCANPSDGSSPPARYAAVMGGSMCFCASRYIWRTSASLCNQPCAGAVDQVCGSIFNSLAFATDLVAYDNWQLGYPTVGGSCATIKIDHSLNTWKDTSCNLPLPFICRFDDLVNNVTASKAGTIQSSSCQDGICFFLFTSPELVWLDADSFCENLGGRLAKIDSSDLQSQINTMLADPAKVTAGLVWIGATNRFWHYTSDNSLPSFSGWISVVEPISPDANQCAAMVLKDDGSYGWKSKVCNSLTDTKYRFVCESVVSNLTTLPQAPTTPTQRKTDKKDDKSSETTLKTEGTTDGEFIFTDLLPGESPDQLTHRTITVRHTTRQRPSSPETQTPSATVPSSTPRSLPSSPSTPRSSPSPPSTTRTTPTTPTPAIITPTASRQQQTTTTYMTSTAATPSIPVKLSSSTPTTRRFPFPFPWSQRQPLPSSVSTPPPSSWQPPSSPSLSTGQSTSLSPSPPSSSSLRPSPGTPFFGEMTTTLGPGTPTPQTTLLAGTSGVPSTSDSQTSTGSSSSLPMPPDTTTGRPPSPSFGMFSPSMPSHFGSFGPPPSGSGRPPFGSGPPPFGSFPPHGGMTPPAPPAPTTTTTPTTTTKRLCAAVCRNVTTTLASNVTTVTVQCWPVSTTVASSSTTTGQTTTAKMTTTAKTTTALPTTTAKSTTAVPTTTGRSTSSTTTAIHAIVSYGPEYDSTMECPLPTHAPEHHVGTVHAIIGIHLGDGHDDHSTDHIQGGDAGAQADDYGHGATASHTTAPSNSGLSWWAVLLIVVACLAVVAAGLGIAIYFMKKAQASHRVSHSDNESSSREKSQTSTLASTPAPKKPGEASQPGINETKT